MLAKVGKMFEVSGGQLMFTPVWLVQYLFLLIIVSTAWC